MSSNVTVSEKYMNAALILIWRIFGDSSGSFNPTVLIQKMVGLFTMITSYGFSIYLLSKYLFL